MEERLHALPRVRHAVGAEQVLSGVQGRLSRFRYLRPHGPSPVLILIPMLRCLLSPTACTGDFPTARALPLPLRTPDARARAHVSRRTLEVLGISAADRALGGGGRLNATDAACGCTPLAATSTTQSAYRHLIHSISDLAGHWSHFELIVFEILGRVPGMVQMDALQNMFCWVPRYCPRDSRCTGCRRAACLRVSHCGLVSGDSCGLWFGGARGSHPEGSQTS